MFAMTLLAACQDLQTPALVLKQFLLVELLQAEQWSLVPDLSGLRFGFLLL
jgi:hypothetical protein